MPDYIGSIAVPEITPSGTFPIVPDYPYGMAQAIHIAEHQFGRGNAKITQRFLLGTGAKRFTVRRAGRGNKSSNDKLHSPAISPYYKTEKKSNKN